MGPPEVVETVMQQGSIATNPRVNEGDYTSFYSDTFHRAPSSREKRFSFSSYYSSYYIDCLTFFSLESYCFGSLQIVELI